MPDTLFVYGSLLSLFNHPLNLQLQRQGRFLDKAHTTGRLYDLGRYPAAVKHQNSIIVGELYQLAPSNSLWTALDDYEGYNEESLPNSEYIRAQTQVQFNGQMRQSWIYWYNRPLNQAIHINGGDYQGFRGQQAHGT